MIDDTSTDGDDATHGIDWNEFWTGADEERRRSAHVGQYGNPDLLERFFEETTVPRSFASVGSGPAACPVALAERYPEMRVFGYDAAESVVQEARDRADDANVEATFAVGRLPDFEVDRRFDLVYCYATLHYVRDVETALRRLYDCTRDGGYLVFNYPNRLTAAADRRLLAGDADRPLPGDPDQFRERFRLVLEEANLLSYDRIADILGTHPRSFWSAVDAPDEPWVGRHNPCVYVPK